MSSNFLLQTEIRMRHILMFLTLVLICTADGQAQPGAIKYYTTINQAELAICRKDLPTAFRYFQKAFEINPDKPFSRDLLNAYHCAMDLRRYDKAETYLQVLLSRGVNQWAVKSWIRKGLAGADLDSVDRWLAIYPNDTNKSDALSVQLRQMHDRDQATRRYFSKLNDGKYMVDSVYKIDQLNGDTLAMIFKKYGVPDEGRVGHLDGYPGGAVYGTVIHHYMGGYGAGLGSHILDTMLFKAIFTYDFHPVEFLKIFNSSEANVTKTPFKYRNYTLHTPVTIDYINLWVADSEQVFPQYLASEVESRMNKERAALGIESLDELRNKQAFSREAAAANAVYNKYALGNSFGAALDSDDPVKAAPYIAEFSKYKPKPAPPKTLPASKQSYHRR